MQHMLDYEIICQMVAVAAAATVYIFGGLLFAVCNVVAQYLYAKLEQVRVADLSSNTAPGGDSWSVQHTVSEEGLNNKWFWNALVMVCGSFI